MQRDRKRSSRTPLATGFNGPIELDVELESQESQREELCATLAALRRENVRLLQELVDSQRNYQDVLRAALTEQQLYRQLIHHKPPIPDKSATGNSLFELSNVYVQLINSFLYWQ